MLMISLKTAEIAVRQYIDSPPIAGALGLLRGRLPHTAEMFIVGGAIRNLVMTQMFGKAPCTEDIDIFIKGLPDDFSLARLLKGEAFEPTDLDGIRWYPGASPMAFDLCMLQKFVTLQKYRLAPTRSNLLDCIDFTINTIVFEIHSEKLFENRCIASIRNRCLDFNTYRFYTKQLTAYRVLLIRHKTGFRVSGAVFNFLKHQLLLSDLSDLKGLFKAKLGNQKARMLMDERDRICAFSNYGSYVKAAQNNPSDSMESAFGISP